MEACGSQCVLAAEMEHLWQQLIGVKQVCEPVDELFWLNNGFHWQAVNLCSKTEQQLKEGHLLQKEVRAAMMVIESNYSQLTWKTVSKAPLGCTVTCWEERCPLGGICTCCFKIPRLSIYTYWTSRFMTTDPDPVPSTKLSSTPLNLCWKKTASAWGHCEDSVEWENQPKINWIIFWGETHTVGDAVNMFNATFKVLVADFVFLKCKNKEQRM